MLSSTMIPINLALLAHIDKEVEAARQRGDRSATIWLNPDDNIGKIKQLLLARKFSVVVTYFDYKMEIFW